MIEDMKGFGATQTIPMVMFPDRRHLIRKWRKHLQILGNGVAQFEHTMKT